MPRIAGVNLVGVLLAAVAMFFVGFLWYGLLFSDIWMAGRGYVEADFEGANQAWMAGGLLIELVMAFGLGWLLKRQGISMMSTALAFALPLGLLIAVPLASYEFIYGLQHSVGAWLVDASHRVVTLLVGAAVLSLLD
ncbi:MAG: DUF1761 domain-containing protein [Hyphomonadaceae bacterium]|nr:DUF1761 domain-containing protein [Hyphomonadaceae bacterium]